MHIHLLRPLLAGLLASAAGVALAVPAGEDGVSLGAQLGLIHDDNPLARSPGFEPQSDRLIYTAANAGWSGRYSLQQFGIAGSVKDVRYDRLSSLDYRSYSQAAFWNWALADRLSGRLAYTVERTPVSLKYFSGTEIDLLRSLRPEASVAWALTPDWYVDARYQPTTNTHSLAERRYLDNESREQRYRLGFKLTSGIGGGVQLRASELSYTKFEQRPIGSLLDSGSQDRESSLYASWNPSERTRFNGRVGYMRRSYDHAVIYTEGRDFSGGIGAIDAAYNLSSDIGLTLNLARQVGGEEESAFGSYAVHRIGGLGANWRITPLVGANAGWRDERIVYQGGVERADRERITTLGLAYKPHRLVDIGLNYQIDRRTSTYQYADFIQRQVSLFAAINY